MASTLLSFTLIALSFFTFSQARPSEFNVANFAGRLPRPADTFVTVGPHGIPGYVPATADGYLHIRGPKGMVVPPNSAPGPSSYEAFRNLPKVQAVVDGASAAIDQGHAPLTAEFLDDWKYVKKGAAALSEEQRLLVYNYLMDQFAYRFSDSKKQEGVRNYAWSLLQSERNPKTIWWSKSLADAGSGQKKGFVDLVRLGETLSFGSKKAGFEIPRKDLEDVAHDLANILVVDGEGHDRTQALPVKSLMSYKDDSRIPMYQSRISQVMKYLLEDFDQQNTEQKLKVMNRLFLYTGFSPEAASKLAQSALRPKNSRELSSIISSAGDYNSIVASLNRIKK